MNGNSILLAESDPDDRDLTRRVLLRGAPVTQVDVVHTGREALDYLFCQGRYSGRDPDREPRVVLLARDLLDPDGHAVLRALRSDERTRCLPVVVMSSSDAEEDRALSYQLGANSYVEKLVDFDAFGERLRALKSYWLGVNRPARARRSAPPQAP